MDRTSSLFILQTTYMVLNVSAGQGTQSSFAIPTPAFPKHLKGKQMKDVYVCFCFSYQ